MCAVCSVSVWRTPASPDPAITDYVTNIGVFAASFTAVVCVIFTILMQSISKVDKAVNNTDSNLASVEQTSPV